jgi:hypothetical protein
MVTCVTSGVGNGCECPCGGSKPYGLDFNLDHRIWTLLYPKHLSEGCWSELNIDLKGMHSNGRYSKE